jgi:hypothetical protein
LSRHRIIQFSRSKAIVLLAAGAFSVATAASAAAATGAPSSPRSSAAGAHDADLGGRVTVTDRVTPAQGAAQDNVSQVLRAYQVRDAVAEFAAARWQAARERAAKEAAAARPAAQPSAGSAAPAQSAPAQSASAQSAPAQPAPAAASGSPQQIAEAMLGSFGWSSSQFSCLDPLWAHESGWSVTAYNAGTGAYGIPQALPGSRMASAGPDWQTDAATQIRWGLQYIQATYGSPCAAWDHEQATGWY